MDSYCNICGGEDRPLVAMNDGKSICYDCGKEERFR